MAKASPNAKGPNATYIPPAHIGKIGGRVGEIGSRVGSLDNNMLVLPTQRGSWCSGI